MSDNEYFRMNVNPVNLVKSIAFDIAFMRNNPDYFEPCGIWCFVGAQG